MNDPNKPHDTEELIELICTELAYLRAERDTLAARVREAAKILVDLTTGPGVLLSVFGDAEVWLAKLPPTDPGQISQGKESS